MCIKSTNNYKMTKFHQRCSKCRTDADQSFIYLAFLNIICVCVRMYVYVRLCVCVCVCVYVCMCASMCVHAYTRVYGYMLIRACIFINSHDVQVQVSWLNTLYFQCFIAVGYLALQKDSKAPWNMKQN